MTFPGLRKFIAERSKTRVLAFLNIACHGMAGAGCSGTDFGPGGHTWAEDREAYRKIFEYQSKYPD